MKIATTHGPAERLARLAMPAARRAARMALDRAISARRTDQDGHLFVADCNLSAAAVSPYRSEEVVGWKELGLRPGQVVQLLRPAEELARAAPSFRGKPLLLEHRPVSSEDHPHRSVVGSVGSDVRFDARSGFLVGSLTVWDQAAVDLIESGEQRAISCGYRYDIDPTAGAYQGERYQFRMVNLVGNHVSIVPEGRVKNCLINDAALKGPTMSGTARPPGISDRDELDVGIVSQLKSYLADLLTPDQLEAVARILDGQSVPPATMAGDAAARRVAARVVAAHRAKQERSFFERFPEARRLAR